MHIALNELGLPYEEELIDLDKPRTEAYLKINPRGLVPSLRFNDEIITESGIVSQFLADAYPSHLVPPSNTAEGALRRARVAFFVDNFFTKFQNHVQKFALAKTDAEAEAGLETAIAGLVREVEPLLADAKPFFGGAEKLTLAEVSLPGCRWGATSRLTVAGPDRIVRHPPRQRGKGGRVPRVLWQGHRRQGAQLPQMGSGGGLPS